MNIKSKHISFISVVCAFSVLFLHTNGCFWELNPKDRYWISANFIECLLYFAVPLFFIISGITLIDFYDRYTLIEFFKKRFWKTVFPFLTWNGIAIAKKIYSRRIDIEKLNFKYIYQGIANNEFIGFFWFLNALFVVYLSVPLFAAVEKEKRRIVFSYLVIVGFVLNNLVPFLDTLFCWDLNLPYKVTVTSGNLLWIPLGWLLENSILNKIQKIIIYIFAILGFLMHSIGTYILSVEAGEVILTFKGYNNVPCVLYSVGIFILLKDIGSVALETKMATFIKWLAGYTYPIYLMQFLLFDLVGHMSFVNTKSLLYRLGAPFIMASVIVAITSLMRRNPLLKKMVP